MKFTWYAAKLVTSCDVLFCRNEVTLTAEVKIAKYECSNQVCVRCSGCCKFVAFLAFKSDISNPGRLVLV
jgi:hypothetical protein